MTRTPERLRAGLVLPDLPVRTQFAEAMRAALPALDLRVLDPLPPGDSAAPARDLEVLFTFGQFINNEVLAPGSAVRWVQSLGTGMDGIIDRPTLQPDVLVTSARGVHGVCVPETAFALMLSLARDIPRLVKAQAERAWTSGPAHLLHGRTVGILGVGIIAEGLAQRCKAFGMRVEGISSRTEAPGFDALHPYETLTDVVGRFDHLVLVAPLSERTRHIVDATVLARMKPGAFLVNVARGGLLDEDALLTALQKGQLAGAALDVFAVEPLPAQHPFWTLPNLLITPHTGGQHHDYAAHVMPIVIENWQAYRQGRFAALRNVVRAPAGMPPCSTPQASHHG